jgi:MvaI/BcnI restriction endonuclease family
MAGGAVYYDPGIKLEHASTDPEVKRRSQFRVASKNIAALYESVEAVEV